MPFVLIARYHHTPVDTVDHVAPEQLQLNAANLAVWAYTIANLPELLPRGDDPAPPDPRKSSTSGAGGPSTTTIVTAVVLSLVGVGALAGGAAVYVWGRSGKGPLRSCLKPGSDVAAAGWARADMGDSAYAALSKLPSSSQSTFRDAF